MENSFYSSSLPISYHGYPVSHTHPNELENNVGHPLYLPFHEKEAAMQNQGILPGSVNLQQTIFPTISVLPCDFNSSSNSTSVSCVEMEFSGSRELGFPGGYGDFINQQVPHCPHSLLNNELSLTLGSSGEKILFRSGNSLRTGGRDDLGNPNSCYMEVMEHILSEFGNYALENLSELDDSLSTSCSSGRTDAGCSSERNELIAMLEMVDEGYSSFLLQIQSVVKKFQAATSSEVGQTAAHLAMREISRFHRSLREKIMAQMLEEEKSFASPQLKNEQQTWRPQRGLPEKSVAVLRAWMFQNFLHPYPKDSEKHILALKSGLTRSQVSNWFINARVRLWKPMIEEMHLEVCKKEQAQDANGDLRGRHGVGDRILG